MMFQRESVAKFYDEYGIKEWERLDQVAYHRLLYLLHCDFLKSHVGEGFRVLDAGCGGGRFSIFCASQGSDVTLLDVSEQQLRIAKTKCEQAGVANKIGGSIQASVTDMRTIPDNSFDTVVCYGGVLNYLHEEAEKAIEELCRITKNNGTVFASVNNRFGILRTCATEQRMPLCDFWGKPEQWGIYEVLDTDNETAYPGAKHPPRHFFTSAEIKNAVCKKRARRYYFGRRACDCHGSAGKHGNPRAKQNCLAGH
ncbi:MAG: class I SAM-dependent methyltransferase [Oscillospiraceae bacterium]|jgi:ubiquinone/menaquinone biosynthesis C-methylase UbiE|nr:class I SAM-dependent methyltransferase [Oscillospiraceae bacterium]